ncbi:hypothetical protein I79_005684 [Cricetulus griseus]|uniref:Uncharacterized protein n=1 Tax=Cricetulus griseus TaxID=10029 RepID=G3H5U2_CRIGR|nr:hypothetical protein I79_005684 [Cricetulus griseus]
MVDRCPQLPWVALTPLLFCGCVPTGRGSPPSKGPSLLIMSSWPAQAMDTGHAQ